MFGIGCIARAYLLLVLTSGYLYTPFSGGALGITLLPLVVAVSAYSTHIALTLAAVFAALLCDLFSFMAGLSNMW